MSTRFGEPHTSNFEGAPTLVYEVWSWPEERPAEMYYDVDFGKNNWHFHGYSVLSLRQVLRYREFGYLIERSHARDRSGSPPLFPRVAATGQDQGHGMDPVSMPEPRPSGS